MASPRLFVVVGLASLLALTGIAVMPPAAQADTSSTIATKRCVSAPTPARPDAGIPGLLYTRPASAPVDLTDLNAVVSAGEGDPFAPGSTTTIAEVYGYGYRWTTYDTGCLLGWGTPASMSTGVANMLLGAAASVNALTHSEFNIVISPVFLQWLDDAMREATVALREGFFAPWFTPVVLLVGCLLLWGASKADAPKTITAAGWAVLVLASSTYLMSYPVETARAVDGVIQEAVSTAARGQLPPPPPPYSPDYVAPGSEDAAQRAIDWQLDIINRNTLYKSWLEGALGSSTSAVASEHGPDLFRASHLSWREAGLVDAGRGATIIEQKQALWTTTAAKVEEVDAAAYRQLTGNQGRWDGAVMALFSVASSMFFLVVAGFFIVVSYLAIRVLIPISPALGVFGMLYPLSGWMMSVVGKIAKIIVLGPVFFAAALVNLIIVTAVIGRGALGIIIGIMVPMLLYSILRPRGAATVRQLMRGGHARIGQVRRRHQAWRRDRNEKKDARENRGRRQKRDRRNDGEQDREDGPVYRSPRKKEGRHRSSRRGDRSGPERRRKKRVAGHRPQTRPARDREKASPQDRPRSERQTRRQRTRPSERRVPEGQGSRVSRTSSQEDQKRRVKAAAMKLAAQVVVEAARSRSRSGGSNQGKVT